MAARNIVGGSDSSGEEDNNELDFDEWSDDEENNSKRRRVDPPKAQMPTAIGGVRRSNNVWADVVVGEVLSSEVSGVLLTKKIPEELVERGSETYNVVLRSQLASLSAAQQLNHDLMEFRNQATISKSTGRDIVEYGDPIVDSGEISNGNEIHPSQQQQQQQRKRKLPARQQRQNGSQERQPHSSSKGPVKERLGPKMVGKDEHPHIECLEFNLDGSPPDICVQIAQSLREPKSQLISAICGVIGVPKTIELYKKTVEIENSGGMLTLRGDRRKTPGGVFIQLVKDDPTVNKVQIDKIFEDDRKEWRAKQTGRRQFQSATPMAMELPPAGTGQLKDLKGKKEVFLAGMVPTKMESVKVAPLVVVSDEMEDGEIAEIQEDNSQQPSLTFEHTDDLVSHRTVKLAGSTDPSTPTNSRVSSPAHHTD